MGGCVGIALWLRSLAAVDRCLALTVGSAAALGHIAERACSDTCWSVANDAHRGCCDYSNIISNLPAPLPATIHPASNAPCPAPCHSSEKAAPEQPNTATSCPCSQSRPPAWAPAAGAPSTRPGPVPWSVSGPTAQPLQGPAPSMAHCNTICTTPDAAPSPPPQCAPRRSATRWQPPAPPCWPQSAWPWHPQPWPTSGCRPSTTVSGPEPFLRPAASLHAGGHLDRPAHLP